MCAFGIYELRQHTTETLLLGRMLRPEATAPVTTADPVQKQAKTEYAKLQQLVAIPCADCDHEKEGKMNRERALKIVLVLVGLLVMAGVIPLTMFFPGEPAVPMIMSIYVTLGIFCCWQRVTQRRTAA